MEIRTQSTTPRRHLPFSADEDDHSEFSKEASPTCHLPPEGRTRAQEAQCQQAGDRMALFCSNGRRASSARVNSAQGTHHLQSGLALTRKLMPVACKVKLSATRCGTGSGGQMVVSSHLRVWRGARDASCPRRRSHRVVRGREVRDGLVEGPDRQDVAPRFSGHRQARCWLSDCLLWLGVPARRSVRWSAILKSMLGSLD
ncbi:hypothetical protein CONLIGDRAFT_414784 [Coniochaeta ligniaria NRRL 30616]|uniref:Uncharacterized protein n=1 Tax=Coniochaeta ligniaria NRRL 30616 TaxID=1408157 RepID=A0A1J7IZ23_9PEZI|nr:hypothetical protein CONLIGDRAFT_414784 [Coniochaeta ligniaria NRRL 30616]